MERIEWEWADWESGDTVHVPAATWPHGRIGHGDLIRRVATAFRVVTFDWIVGDEWVAARLQKLIELNGPPVILQAERKMFGRTALVSVADDPGGCRVRFFLTLTEDTESLDLNYQPADDFEGGRALGRKLAEVLGYTFSTAEDDKRS